MKKQITLVVWPATLLLLLAWANAYPEDRGFEVIEQSTTEKSPETKESAEYSYAAVLDPTNHPETPYTSSFTIRNPVSLDHNMSWTERFLGNEEFNPATSLPVGKALPGSLAGEQMAESDKPRVGKFDAIGTIKGIQTSSGKLKIAHGPISKLDMPAMSMVFKVGPGLSIEGLDKGQQVGFNVENTSAGMVLTEISPFSEATNPGQRVGSTGAADAIGMVKSIKPGAGKVKIQHGPIEKYGMPGMTMVFRVTDKRILQQIAEGQKVSFDVNSTSAGFVITRIEIVKEASQ